MTCMPERRMRPSDIKYDKFTNYEDGNFLIYIILIHLLIHS